jgi:hypothetical protein
LGPSDLACCKNISLSFSVKELNHYQKLADFLKHTKTDATDFVCGNSVPFLDMVRDDELKDALN